MQYNLSIYIYLFIYLFMHLLIYYSDCNSISQMLFLSYRSRISRRGELINCTCIWRHPFLECGIPEVSVCEIQFWWTSLNCSNAMFQLDSCKFINFELTAPPKSTFFLVYLVKMFSLAKTLMFPGRTSGKSQIPSLPRAVSEASGRHRVLHSSLWLHGWGPLRRRSIEWRL